MPIRSRAGATISRVGRDPLLSGGYLVLAAQFVLMVAFCFYIYHRFTLGIDLAEYGQAFSAIGTGHMDPTCTICGYSYLHSHFEVGMWPLSILYTIFRSLFVLLVVQALSIVVTNAVVLTWARSVVRDRAVGLTAERLIVAAVAVVLVIDPLAYGTIALDFHFEATATLFAVLSAYFLWSGRYRAGLVAAGLCLLWGDIGGLYVVGVGVSALLAGRATRKYGLLLLIGGVIWIGIIGSLGANKGSFTGQYAYLAGRTTLPNGFGAAVVLLGGMVGHPHRWASVIYHRLHYIGRYVLTGGVFGLITPWGFGVPAVVLLSSALQQSTLFIGEPFQQIAVTPFVLIGTVSFVSLLLSTRAVGAASGGRHSARRRALGSGRAPLIAGGVAVGVLAVAGAAFQSHRSLTASFRNNAVGGFIPAGEAATLRTILSKTPSGTEVIASLPISGRFGARKYIYLYDMPTSALPINARQVELVLDTAHTTALASPQQDMQAVAFVRAHYGATTVATGEDVVAVKWTAPRVGTSVVLP